MTLAHQQLNSDYEKLKQEEAEKSAKLQDLMYVSSATVSSDSLKSKLNKSDFFVSA